MEQTFAGKVAVVTGAGSGIGKCAVKALVERGASVGAIDINGEGLAALANEFGDRVFTQTADVSNEGQVADAISGTVSRFDRLDCALNNAAVIPPVAPIAEIELSDWQRTLDINLTGPLLCLKYEIRQMLAQGEGGAIVNLASAASLIAYPGRPGYVASKHGLAGLTKAAAVEYGRAGIRVNAICPGLVLTPMADELLQGSEEYKNALLAMFPLGRAAEPEEIADIALMLLSPVTRYMTGAIVSADAGFTAQ